MGQRTKAGAIQVVDALKIENQVVAAVAEPFGHGLFEPVDGFRRQPADGCEDDDAVADVFGGDHWSSPLLWYAQRRASGGQGSCSPGEPPSPRLRRSRGRTTYGRAMRDRAAGRTRWTGR